MKKSVKETSRKCGKANRCRNLRNWFKKDAYSNYIVGYSDLQNLRERGQKFIKTIIRPHDSFEMHAVVMNGEGREKPKKEYMLEEALAFFCCRLIWLHSPPPPSFFIANTATDIRSLFVFLCVAGTSYLYKTTATKRGHL